MSVDQKDTTPYSSKLLKSREYKRKGSILHWMCPWGTKYFTILKFWVSVILKCRHSNSLWISSVLSPKCHSDRGYCRSLLLLLAALGLQCYAQAFSGCSELRLLCSCGVWASHCGGFSCCRAQALEPSLSCSTACGTFLDQGSNWCTVHCKVDS